MAQTALPIGLGGLVSGHGRFAAAQQGGRAVSSAAASQHCALAPPIDRMPFMATAELDLNTTNARAQYLRWAGASAEWASTSITVTRHSWFALFMVTSLSCGRRKHSRQDARWLLKEPPRMEWTALWSQPMIGSQYLNLSVPSVVPETFDIGRDGATSLATACSQRTSLERSIEEDDLSDARYLLCGAYNQD